MSRRPVPWAPGTGWCPLAWTWHRVTALNTPLTHGPPRALGRPSAGGTGDLPGRANMPSIRRLLVIPAVAVIAACGGNDRNEQPLDSGLSNDLALAATAQQMPPAQYMSP